MKKYNEFINEGVKDLMTPKSREEISKIQDYNYFNSIIDELSKDYSDKQIFITDLRKNRDKWISLFLIFAKHDWVNGDGKPNEFPKVEFTKVINEVIDEIIK